MPGTKIGLEVLANAHIKNYPNPSTAWIDEWYKMLDLYEIIPVEYGHWVDTKLYSETKHSTQKRALKCSSPTLSSLAIGIYPRPH